MPNTDFQDYILNNFPYPISINYLRIIEARSWKDKVEQSIRVFEFLVRSVTLTLVSQYLIVDRDKKLSDKRLNHLLKARLEKPSLGSWVDLFFTLLNTYSGRPDLLLMPELYDFYWNKKQKEPNKRIRIPFADLVTIRNDIAHGLPPLDDTLWQDLYNRTEDALNKILEFFEFLANYDLIYIVRQDADQYWYLSYRGRQIKEIEQPLRTDHNLTTGWFYFYQIRGKNQNLIRLYPFIISWAKDADSSTPGMQEDAALFDKYSSSRIFYLATVIWEKFTIEDEPLLADFFYNFDRTLSIKMQESQPLSWDELRDVAKQISSRRLGGAIEKYDPGLYLQRRDVLTIYQTFLESKRKCLVITGKSGVGKTNFLISLSQDVSYVDTVCSLFYNGASLPVDSSFEDILQSDFQQPDEASDGLREVRLWTELARLNRENDVKLVIFIDAINENPEPAKLLHRINYFVETLPYAWVKVVITSRPEAWRVISHSIRLSTQHYFWQAGSDRASYELKEFSEGVKLLSTVTIDKFSKSELQLAYEKYREKFNLLSSYEDISVEVRHTLRDPLILRLMAEIFSDKEIPRKFSSSNIFQEYLNRLLASERIKKADLQLLEKEIVPLMTKKLDNALSEDDIYPNRILYERIFISERLSNETFINQSYVNLVDSEIMVSLVRAGHTNIAFKFERFFEYFVGEYFYQSTRTEQDTVAAYLKLIQLTQSRPFLWGAVKNALLLEMRDGNDDLIYQLASHSDQSIREILSTALSEFGQHDGKRDACYKVTQDLLVLQKPRLFSWETIRSLVSLPADQSPNSYSAAIIALEVSLNLEFDTILLEAAKHRIQSIRVFALRNIYHLWRKNPPKSLQILEDLAIRTTNRLGFPNFTIIESCIGLSLLLLRDYHPEKRIGQELGKKLVSIWQAIIRQIFFVSAAELSSKRLVRSALRSLILSFIVRSLVLLIEGLPGAKDYLLGDAGLFFHESLQVKNRYRRFIQFLRNPGDIDEIRKDVVEAIPENDGITSIVVMLIFIIQGKIQKTKTLSLLRELATLSLQQEKPGWYDAASVRAVGYIGLEQDYPSDEAFFLSESIIKNRLEANRGIYYSNKNTRHWNSDLSLHNLMRYSRHRSSDMDLYAHFLRLANQEKDLEYLEVLIVDLTHHAITFRNPDGALEALSSIFPISDERIIKFVTTSLIKIRDHYPEIVKDFVLEFDGEQQSLSNEVLRSESNEKPWVDLLQISSAEILIRLIRTEQARTEIVEILAEVMYQVKWNSYFDVAIKRVVNLIAGIQLFPVIDRRHADPLQ